MIYNLSEIIKNQPIINVGCIGHVSHGKSTIVKKYTGKKTQKHSNEIQRGITILLGYANLKIYYNHELDQFKYSSHSIEEDGFKLLNHLSFVDCPGHHALMSTMISGSKVFDAAILLIAANDDIPQVQTIKHTEVLKYSNIEDLVIVFNKIDLLMTESVIDEKVDQLAEFLSNHEQLKNKSVLPISAEKEYNLDTLLKFLCNQQKPIQHLCNRVMQPFKMCVLRTFDINPKGVSSEKLSGGVVGGSILSGHLKIGDKVGIFPGYVSKINTQWIIKPIFSTVKSLQSEENKLDACFPGGLIAIGLECDPSLCKQNNLLGSVIFKIHASNYKSFLDSENYSNEIFMHIDYIIDNLHPIMDVILIVNSRPIKGILEKNELFDKVILQQPIYIDKTEKIPILIHVEKSIEMLGIGMFLYGTRKTNVHLPSDFEQFVENLSFADDEIIINNDIDEFYFRETNFSPDSIKNTIKSYLHDNISKKIKFPKLQISYETNKIVWCNFHVFSELVENIEKKIDLSSLKILCLSKTIIAYISFSYGIDDLKNFNLSADCLSITYKIKRLQTKLEKVIQIYFKNNHYCDKCKQISCCIIKMGGSFIKICMSCGDRVALSDPWINNI